MNINKKLLSKKNGGLLGFGVAYNTESNAVGYNANDIIAFSDNAIKNKSNYIKNYINEIITFENGTFKIHTKGLVGMVKATITLSGLGDSNFKGFWWAGNKNSLPNGVTMLEDFTGAISSAANNSYGGTSKSFLYNIDTDDDIEFLVDPRASVYGGTFTPTRAGTRCILQIEVYAKNN